MTAHSLSANYLKNRGSRSGIRLELLSKMKNSSRVKKSFQNVKVNLICFFVNLLVTFFSRSYLLNIFGTEFVGFTATIQSILGFLNIAELGVGAAVAYHLYSPLYNDDRNQIGEIVSVLGFFYRIIGLLILTVGIIVSLFLPDIFTDVQFSKLILYLGFYSFLYNSMLGYFVNYRQTLLSADQRNYEVTGLYQIITASKGLVQILSALYLESIIAYFIIEIIFTTLFSVILNIRINSIYIWLKTTVSSGRNLVKKYPNIGKKVKQIFIHKIGGFFQDQSLPMVIYAFVSLPMVALYTNYTTISNSIKNMISTLLSSTGASIGNLIAEGNTQRIVAIYKQLFTVSSIIAGIVSLCFYELSNEFVANWIGPKYELDKIVVALISVQLFLSLFRMTTEQFINAFGLFGDIWAPIVESMLFIILASLLGYFCGLKGILLGPILSTTIIIHLWKPFYLFTRGLKLPFRIYIKMVVRCFMLLLISYLTSKYIADYMMELVNNGEPTTWQYLIVHTLVFSLILTTIYICLSFVFSVDIREFIYLYVFKYKKKNYNGH